MNSTNRMTNVSPPSPHWAPSLRHIDPNAVRMHWLAIWEANDEHRPYSLIPLNYGE